MIRHLAIAGIATISLALAACNSAELDDPASTDVTDSANTESSQQNSSENRTLDGAIDLISTAESAGNFTTLLTALEAANLRSVLADTNNINTVFAPTDNAFAALGEDNLAALLADSEQLTDTLLYHVLAGVNDNTFLRDFAGSQLTMLNNKQAAITADPDFVQFKINTANITDLNILASNGIIHVIDAVLTPPADPVTPTTTESTATETIAEIIGGDAKFSTLLSAATATGLDSTLAQGGSFTLFAPTDAAFAKLDESLLSALLADSDQLREVLLNHVVEDNAIDSVAATAAAGTSITSAAGTPLDVTLDGDSLNINNATVIEADLAATNGVVHVIDTVLLPQALQPDSIVAVLAANPDYSALVALITQAGLVDTLNNVDERFTLFAPNNAAVAAAQSQLAAGFINDTAALGNLLLGHVTGEALSSAQLIARAGTNLTMASGSQPVVFNQREIVLSIGGAIIVDPDIQSANGIIHGVNSLLLP